MTEKGHGYAPARANEADQFHAVVLSTPKPASPVDARRQSWTSVFAEEIADIADEREDIVGITGAMLIPVGLHKFAATTRTGSSTSASPSSTPSRGRRAWPLVACILVVALYATFLNRAFDQLLMDVALHKAGVTVVLDRAGVTGPDGPEPHGMWDMAMVQIVPGLHLAAPRDATQVEAKNCWGGGRHRRRPHGGPVFQRLASAPRLKPSSGFTDGVDVLARRPTGSTENDVLIVSVGAMR